MQPYVIKQGDYLARLAYVFGFDANQVWNDPANDDLRKLRPDPNMLCPTDILYIPNQAAATPPMPSLATGQTNNFVSDAPTVKISIKFSNPSRASQAFTISELDSLTGLTTDSGGAASFSVPVSLEVFTVVFTNDGASFQCKVGHIDPIDTLSGVVQRLQNLGYLDPSASYGLATIDEIRRALWALRYVQTGGSPSTGGAPADSTPSPASSQDGSGDDSSGDDSGGDDSGGDDSGDDDSGGDDSGGDDSGGDDSGGDDDSDDSQSPDSGPVDNAGLDDSGVLNDEMTKHLHDAHGS